METRLLNVLACVYDFAIKSSGNQLSAGPVFSGSSSCALRNHDCSENLFQALLPYLFLKDMGGKTGVSLWPSRGMKYPLAGL